MRADYQPTKRPLFSTAYHLCTPCGGYEALHKSDRQYENVLIFIRVCESKACERGKASWHRICVDILRTWYLSSLNNEIFYLNTYRIQRLPMRNKTKTKRKRWEPEEVQYLREYYSKKSLKELSLAMGRSVPSIRIAAHALDITKGRRDVRFHRT